MDCVIGIVISLLEYDPSGRMVARASFASNLSIDTRLRKAVGKRWADQQVVNPQARISLPSFPQVMPKRVHRLVWMESAERVGPALIDDPLECGTALGLHEGVVRP